MGESAREGILQNTLSRKTHKKEKEKAMEELRDENGLTEAEFLARYDASKFERPSVTVDIIIIKDGKVLLIKRGRHPGLNKLAFPGGFVDPGENVYQAAVRELFEETHLRAVGLKQMNVASEPKRDPRTRIITVPFLADCVDMGELCADDDAAGAKWYPFSYKKTALGGSVIYEVFIADGESRKSFKVIKSFDKSGVCADPIYKQAGESVLCGDHAEIFVRAIDEMNI